ncbi:MAG TPA: NADH-quinone oxidoreductase subunit N [Thermoleophilia bacterium]|nr:NADH-quinone oxidoreductase subunit N [Thermoleophilia bacterium]
MSGANNDVMVILPGVVVAATALVVFMADTLVGGRKWVLPWIAAAGLIVAAGVATAQWIDVGAIGSVWDFVSGSGSGLFGGGTAESGFASMVALDKFAYYCTLLFCVIGVLTIMLSDAYMKKRRDAMGEFYGLLLLVITGMIGMAISIDVIALFVAFELMSLPTYVLAGFIRGDERSGEAAIKYFINGAFSSAILLFGLALLYAATGQTNYASIAAGLNNLGADAQSGLVIVALVLVAVGFGFKIAAVPFHWWAPDVYEGAPTPVTAFMSVGIKAGAFVGFLKLFTVAVISAPEVWTAILTILAVLTMIVGNALALPQRNLKRMLAYSSIAHAGYILLGLIAVGAGNVSVGASGERVLDTSGSSAVLFYLGAYAFMNIGAFGILVWIRNRRAFRYTLDEVAGLARSMPWTAIAMTLFMLSLTGIPPLVGFWGKLYLFTAIVNAGMTWLAVLAVIMSAVSAYYYLRVVWYMYFREAPGVAPAGAGAAEAGAVQAGAVEAGATVAGAPVTVGAAGALETGAGAAAAEATLVADDAGPAVGSAAAVVIASLGVLVLGLYPSPLISAAQGALRVLLGG